MQRRRRRFRRAGVAVLSAILAVGVSLSILGIFSSRSEAPSPMLETPQIPAETPVTTPEPAPEPSPTEPQPPEFDEEHVLDRELPVLTEQGLELPINGATGFASVQLTLWAEIPQPAAEPEPTPETESVPPPAIEPIPEQDPESPAGETASPLPESSNGAFTDLPETGTPAEEPVPPEVPTPGTTPSPAPFPIPSEDETAAAEVRYLSTGQTLLGEVLAVLEPGTAFTILREEGDWWLVQAEQGIGWVEHRFCMINLPDVIPSILYDATNSYSSRYVSSGQEIPGVTGEALYPGAAYNPRLERDEFLMPMLYAAAKRVCAAQQAALAQGNSLKLYEAYRPRSTQLAVIEGLTALAEADSQVAAGISTPPWEMSDFIATGYSNHQRGVAVDVSLVKVSRTELRSTGGYSYLHIAEYEEYEMPTAIHELSMAAASVVAPGNSILAETMNEAAIALRGYFTGAGMTPLASEWWHFNDFTARSLAADQLCTGGFLIVQCVSRPPES